MLVASEDERRALAELGVLGERGAECLVLGHELVRHRHEDVGRVPELLLCQIPQRRRRLLWWRHRRRVRWRVDACVLGEEAADEHLLVADGDHVVLGQVGHLRRAHVAVDHLALELLRTGGTDIEAEVKLVVAEAHVVDLGVVEALGHAASAIDGRERARRKVIAVEV